MIANVAGLTSSVLICVMFIPEVIHVYKHKDAKAINYWFLHLNLISSILALIYSITYNVIPMTITNISSALFSLILYHYKFTQPVEECL